MPGLRPPGSPGKEITQKTRQTLSGFDAESVRAVRGLNLRTALFFSGSQKERYARGSQCERQRKPIGMANILPMEKQVAALAALCEGTSIRAIERITGVHRDTVMRLGVRVGKACARMHDEVVRDLPCLHIQADEIGGFIGKKQKNASSEEIAALLVSRGLPAAVANQTAFLCGGCVRAALLDAEAWLNGAKAKARRAAAPAAQTGFALA